MEKKVKRIIIDWVFILFVCTLAVVLLVFIEDQLLAQYIIPMDEELVVDTWLTDVFNVWAFVGIVSSFIMIAIWYLVNVFSTFKKWHDLARRILWWALFGLLGAVLLVCFLVTRPTVADYGYLAYIAYGINILGYYYFTTALFSPVAIKYIPPSAKFLRRW